MRPALLAVWLVSACASNARVDSTVSAQLRADEREEIIKTAESFMTAVYLNDSVAMRDLVAKDQPAEWAGNLRRDHPKLIEASHAEFTLVTVHALPATPGEALAEFEVPFRRFGDFCYAAGVNDRVIFHFKDAGNRWLIEAVSMPIC
jgi:hypothetical protein